MTVAKPSLLPPRHFHAMEDNNVLIINDLKAAKELGQGPHIPYNFGEFRFQVRHIHLVPSWKENGLVSISVHFMPSVLAV